MAFMLGITQGHAGQAEVTRAPDAEDRRIFLTESGSPLTKSGLDSAWQRLMAIATNETDGVISPEQYFTLHGLKHRGITDTKGNKAVKRDAAGHRDPRMTDHYDDELQVVDPAETAGYFTGISD